LERDLELAEISICAYQRNACSVESWEQLSSEDLGLSPSHFESDNFRATAYRNIQTGEVVVGFRGTQSLGDIGADMAQFDGHHSNTYQSAVDLATALQRQGIDVTYTGHSLGGGLATAAALQGGDQAVGFNSAALTVESADRYGLDISMADRLVTHLLVPGEIVTSIQETPMRSPLGSGPHNDYGPNMLPWETHPAPGRRDVLDPPHQSVVDFVISTMPSGMRLLLSSDGETAAALHMMVSVMASLRATKQARCS